MKHLVVWMDIPVVDLARAIGFYSRVLHRELHERYPGVAVFEHGKDEVSGCLYVSKDEEPSTQGALLYFSVQGRLDEAEELVEPMGGKILKHRHKFGPFGWRVIVLDSEGNRIALHAATH